MASMEGPSHLLSLKVMRVSRPSLASIWQPFYSSSPSFSAHSTASILSLQGKAPLPGHPKTLRDLTHASELLTLPSSFGSIQLGETFSSCLCVNNEATASIQGISLKVEMQTATSKVTLAEFGPDLELDTGGTLERIIHHEIKELGQHVLACTVAYRLPPNTRGPAPTEENADPALQTFRKFYKFAVTNPLSVKTKVHAPKSPTALMSQTEREKVFLEVHIQNLTQEAMCFQHMRFECADGWDVFDANVFETPSGDTESIFTDSTALMQPQDMRQYIYILTPKTTVSVPVVHAPGSILPLGRLDIAWRSSLGEPGRLLTSMLSRRLPLPPVTNPASALPSYLKRNQIVSTPPRPQSPSQSQPARTSLNDARPGTPPSPYRTRRPSIISPRPESPATTVVTLPPATPQLPAIEVILTILPDSIPRSTLRIDQPFSIDFSLAISTKIPVSATGYKRTLRLAVQHVQPPRVSPNSPSMTIMGPPGDTTPRIASGFSTPSPTYTTFNYALASQKLKLLGAMSDVPLDGPTIPPSTTDTEEKNILVVLPPPYAQGSEELRFSKSPGVKFIGASALFLDPVVLDSKSPIVDVSSAATVPSSTVATEERQMVKVYAEQEFTLDFMPVRNGFLNVGGLRVVLVGDRVEDDDETPKAVDGNNEAEGGLAKEGSGADYNIGSVKRKIKKEGEILKEWETVCEVWVAP